MAMRNLESSEMMGKRQEQVLDLMQQLLDCTGQLARCGEESTDIIPLSNACRRHFLALQQTISGEGNLQGTHTLGKLLSQHTKQPADIPEMLQSLVDQTERCIAALGLQMERTAQELASLRSSQTAIRAYRGR